MNLKSIGMAALGVLSSFLPAQSNAPKKVVPEPSTPTFNEVSFTYELDRQKYAMTLLSASDMSNVGSIDDALAMVSNNTDPAVLLVGDFPPEERKMQNRMLRNMYALNPRLIATLEPVIIQLEPGHASGAITNAAVGRKGFDWLVKRYGGKRKWDDVVRQSESYTGVLHSIRRDIVSIPRSEREYEEGLRNLERVVSTGRPEGWDVFISGVTGKNAPRAFCHEWGHLFAREAGAKGYQLLKDLSGVGGITRLGGSISSMLYVSQRKGEVEDWVKEMQLGFDKLTKLYQGLSPEGRRRIGEALSAEKGDVSDVQFATRLWKALETNPLPTVQGWYKDLLETASLDWKLGEQIAEDVADVFTNSVTYQQSMNLKRDHDETQRRFRETRRGIAKRMRDKLKEETDLTKKRELEAVIDKYEKADVTFGRDLTERFWYEHWRVREFLVNFGK